MKESILNNPDVELYGKIRNVHCFRWFRIVVFEFTATAILMYGVISSQYVSPPYPKPTNYTPILNPTHSIFESCALFLCLCFSGQLTGGHCNPAVTTTLLISKGNKINPFIALIYISSQFVGALVGGLFAWALVQTFDFREQAPLGNDTVLLQLRILLAQIVGTFLYCLFILIVVNDTTSFVKSTFWNYMLIPVAFFISRQTTYQIDSLNPASVLSFQLFSGIKNNNWVPISQYYLYFFGPLIGAVLCGGFFNFFYVPLLVRWKTKK